MADSPRTYVIAEVGINHNGSLDNCLRLIDAAADAGCDAAKLQLFTAKTLYPKSAGRLDWKDDTGSYDYDIYEAVAGFELPLDFVEKCQQHCRARGVDFCSSVFDTAGIDFLMDLGVGSLKLSSYSVTNLPLINAAAATGLPLYLSTGGAALGEVEQAVETVHRHHRKLALMHCSIQYPTPLADCNLGVLDTFRHAFPGVKLGYSDHTMEPADAPAQAVRMGAKVIEKHITLDRSMDGPDHFFALEPQQLAEMVRAIRAAEQEEGHAPVNPTLYGDSTRKCYDHERYLRDFAYACIFAARPIAKGQRITPKDLVLLRPGKKERGLEPKYVSLFGQTEVTAKQDLAPEDPVTWQAILA